MNREFPKAYLPKDTEQKWYQIWQDSKIYEADASSTKKKYSILMPPPNVTGILHFGHVLNISLQDLYIRWKRMQGYEVCWVPGTDHAGIATQTKVERELKKENLSRYDLGREKFVEKVWEWKEKYGGIILKQLRYLGVSCDWNRTIFTMDESAYNAIKEVFIRLFDEGLIYKGKRIINWSPLAQTALSDEEVEFREVREHMFTLRYYFDDSSNYLKVSTVRPETIFGDTAIAVNPNDERYRDYVGKHVLVPLAGRRIPIITDDYADPTFGTECVKITPAHDPNDYEVGIRHDLEMINTINPNGTLNELTGKYDGVERFEARKRILAELKEKDLIEKIEDYTHNVGFSQRGGEPVEPYLSNQWFVNTKPLADPALLAVTDGRIKFYPAHLVKTYEHWMNGIRNWCISRQLWWGTGTPVYYADNGRYTAARDEAEARQKLNLAVDAHVEQDQDVLDTWFSSWLWPLTTMHWKGDGKNDTTTDLEAFLPTDLLVTAPDIIFFWVARMIMATLKFKNELPFKDVYFTSTIRDGQGRKLSKSLGNSPDPINIIDKYGTDAVRFTVLYLSPLGQDIKMDVNVEQQDIPSMETGRNFANKIWNAGRFLLMKLDANNNVSNEKNESNEIKDKDHPVVFDLSYADKWIMSRFHSTLKSIDNSLTTYRVNEYTKTLYDFIWRDFCDWYVEILKVQLNGSSSNGYSKELIRYAINIYELILKMLHPIMPFITEEIWHLLDDRPDTESISLQAYPEADESLIDADLEEEFEVMQMMIEEIRRQRSEKGIPPNQKTEAILSCTSARRKDFFELQVKSIETLAKCSKIEIGMNLTKPDNSTASVIRDTEIFILLDQAMDMDKEKARLQKEIERLERNITGAESKLNNEGFVAKAPESIIQFEREKLESMKEALMKVKGNLDDLK